MNNVQSTSADLQGLTYDGLFNHKTKYHNQKL